MWFRSPWESCLLAFGSLFACFAQDVHGTDGGSDPRELQGVLYTNPGPVVYECTRESGCESCGHFDCNLLIPILIPVFILICFGVMFWCCFFRLGPREKALMKKSNACIMAQHERCFTSGLECCRCDLCRTDYPKEVKLEYCQKCQVTICMAQCRKPIAMLCRQNLHIRYRTTGPHKGFEWKKFTCDICRHRYGKATPFERCERCKVNICNRCAGGKKTYVDFPVEGLKLRTPIAKGFKFHYFLSYKKSPHKTLTLQPESFVQELHEGLAAGGLRGYYNSKSSKKARLEKAWDCSLVIICLNDETLNSSAVQQELKWAAWEGPPIVVVYDGDNFDEAKLRKVYQDAVVLTALPWIGFTRVKWHTNMQQLCDWVAIFSDLNKANKSDVAKFGKLPFETKEQVAKKAEEDAVREGLTLVRSQRWQSGFIGVMRDLNGGFEVHGKDERGKACVLGRYRSPEEAALVFARSLGPEASASLNRVELTEWNRAQKESTDNKEVGNGLNMPGGKMGWSIF